MRRVLELAVRPVDEEAACPERYEGTNKRPYRSLIPLRELIGELLETGAASKKTGGAYGFLIEKAGSEFSLLLDMRPEEIERLKCPGLSGELLALAIRRMRSGEVAIAPGYDGEYGVIRAFPPGEKPGRPRGADLFGDVPGEIPAPQRERRKTAAPEKERKQVSGSECRDGREQPSAPVSLDPDQEKAVFHAGGHAIIVAGPGTGKTFLLASRIARLVENGAAPSSILALTFTVKAASELGGRITKITDSGGITAATFHAFCASLLREHASAAGIPENFEILDESGQEEILKEIVNTPAAKAQGKIHVQTAGKYIEERKRFLLLPGQTVPELPPGILDGLSGMAGEIGPPHPRLESVYREYRNRLKAVSALDFDDLVAGAVRLLAKHGEILSLYRKRFRFIFVDEYQDVNFGQYALIRLLAPGAASGREYEGPELCVIGDPHQAIYAFRGADKRCIDRFLSDYPGAAVYRLTKSFRCAAPIINAAGRLVDTRLEGGPGRGVVINRSGFPTEKAEAEGIARRVSRLIGGTTFFAFDSGIVRASDTGPAGEGALRSLGECAILLRAAALSPPIEKALRDHGIPFHLIGEKPWREEESVYVDAVSILTIHASKGLEFDHVFVAGLEEGILPFTLYDEKDGGEDAGRIDEERRLLYVAMTRARTGLYLSWAGSRIFQGRKLERGPSRFLGEVESLVPRFQDTLPKREKDPQLRLF
jgi:superfamily I DNA/RNA helicase